MHVHQPTNWPFVFPSQYAPAATAAQTHSLPQKCTRIYITCTVPLQHSLTLASLWSSCLCCCPTRLAAAGTSAGFMGDCERSVSPPGYRNTFLLHHQWHWRAPQNPIVTPRLTARQTAPDVLIRATFFPAHHMHTLHIAFKDGPHPEAVARLAWTGFYPHEFRDTDSPKQPAKLCVGSPCNHACPEPRH